MKKMQTYRSNPGDYLERHKNAILAELKVYGLEDVARTHGIRDKYLRRRVNMWNGVIEPIVRREHLPSIEVPGLPQVPNLRVGKSYEFSRWESGDMPKRRLVFAGTSPSRCAGGELFLFLSKAQRLESFTIFQLKDSLRGEASA